MKCKIEIVDGIKGEWRTVTKTEEVKVGQRVRYNGCEIGCYGEKRLIRKFEKGRVVTFDGEDADSGSCNVFRYPTVQAFFPIAKRQKRKVAKVVIGYDFDHYSNKVYHLIVSIGQKQFMVKPQFGGRGYSTHSHAVCGARRFCKTIGFECEIIK